MGLPDLGKPYTELDGSPRPWWRDGRFRATRRLKCAWDDRVQIMLALGENPGWLYPYPDGPQNALVRDIKPVGHGEHSLDEGGLASYSECILLIEHDTEGPQFSGGVLLKEWFRPMAMHLPMDHRRFMWDAAEGGTHIEQYEAPTFIYYGMEYVVTYYRRPQVPANIAAYLGTCNANAVTASTLAVTFPAQTLLYRPPHIETTVRSNGTMTYDITWRYAYHAAGWNTFWRRGANPAAFENLYYAGVGQYIQYPVVAWNT